MKILRIKARGLPLFKKELDFIFYAQKRVSETERDSLYALRQNIYLNPASAIIGINASGKTSVLKVIQLALSIVQNEPLNHVAAKTILGNAESAEFQIYFYDKEENIYCLETHISANNPKNQEYEYTITEERLWRKALATVKTKKSLTDFTGIKPFAVRSENSDFLSDDVSFIIAYNKRMNERLRVNSLIRYTNINVLPFSKDIPLEIVAFLDPTIEKLYFEGKEAKTTIHLKFKGEAEIILNRAVDLEQYLSSGTIKGIITFSMAKEILQNGGYLLVDEIENHFNQEIVKTLLRFFMDSSLNLKGGTLIFTTHYPELLDEYDRNDAIYIVRNNNGIEIQNLSTILTRNDIKKSDAYQSGFLSGTNPTYASYVQLKKSIQDAVA